MKRDPKTDYCVKFTNGLCGIHAQYGTDFLGDACHFYPRATRRLGEETIMTATLSCPEVARLALQTQEGAVLNEGTLDRLPATLKDYLPEGLSASRALAIHRHFLSVAAEQGVSAERLMARLVSVTRSLEALGQDSWESALPFYLKSADARLPAPEPVLEDPFHLLVSLFGLIGASKKTARPRLDETLDEMAAVLAASLNRETFTVAFSESSVSAYRSALEGWEAEAASHYRPFLLRWIQSQLALALFPFAGFGGSPAERIHIIAVRFATVKLALMGAVRAHGLPLPPEVEIRVVQSLARFLDHLADPALTLAIYKETGWLREARLRAVIGDR